MTILSSILIALGIVILLIGIDLIFCGQNNNEYTTRHRIGAFISTCIIMMLILCGIEETSKTHLIETTTLPFIIKEQKDKITLIIDDDKILRISEYALIKRIQDKKVKIIKEKVGFALSIYGINREYIKIMDSETNKELLNERY